MSVWDPLRANASIESLARQMSADGLAHSWLLLGSTGSDKGAAAVAMAAAVNCDVAPMLGCGDCSTCLRILRHRHPDVHHVSPEGTFILVDQIRESVIAEATRSPFEATSKVFILEEADRMNPAAQNALLKTLEEPGPGTMFILLSAREEELLETIRSRCRVIHLQRAFPRNTSRRFCRLRESPATRLCLPPAFEGDLHRARSLTGSGRVGASLAVVIDPSPADVGGGRSRSGRRDRERSREAVREREAHQKDEVVELAEALGEGRGTASARNALAKRHKRELRRVEEAVLADALDTMGSFYRDVLAFRSGGESVTNLDVLEELKRWADSGVSDLCPWPQWNAASQHAPPCRRTPTSR